MKVEGGYWGKGKGLSGGRGWIEKEYKYEVFESMINMYGDFKTKCIIVIIIVYYEEKYW